MQDHFIKNVNDLSLCMTLICDRSGANTEVCTLYTTVNTNTGTVFFWWTLFSDVTVQSCMLFMCPSRSPNEFERKRFTGLKNTH